MGSSVASGYADAIDQGICSLDSALAAHLQSNHYPPLPVDMVPACKRAIKRIEYGSPDRLVLLPKGMKIRHGGEHFTQRPPAWRVAEVCHLDAFINMEVD